MKLAVAALAALLVVPARASGPAEHFLQDVVGGQVVCGAATYTIVSGETKTVIHEGTSASSNANLTGTEVPVDVVLEDEEGNPAVAHGAVWFCAPPMQRRERRRAPSR